MKRQETDSGSDGKVTAPVAARHVLSARGGSRHAEAPDGQPGLGAQEPTPADAGEYCELVQANRHQLTRHGDYSQLVTATREETERRFAAQASPSWEVLSREPMLRSRVFRRVVFAPLRGAELVRAVHEYHPIYARASEELIRFVDDYCGHGNFRNWASFTLTALDLCAELGRPRLDEQVARNAFALLGGGVGAA